MIKLLIILLIYRTLKLFYGEKNKDKKLLKNHIKYFLNLYITTKLFCDEKNGDKKKKKKKN